MFLQKLLPKSDALSLLNIIYKSVLCSTEEDFQELMIFLRNLVPYQYGFCGLARISEDGSIKSYKTINISYPAEWVDLYFKKGFYKIDPIVKENFTLFKTQFWADTYKIRQVPKEFVFLAEDFGLKEGYTSGSRTIKIPEGSLFSMSGKSMERNIRTQIILEHLIPHFHEALRRILTKSDDGKIMLVTQREKEILCWLKEGKSSWEISRILGIAERTVNFHIYNIMEKLGAVNRLQMVAIAFHNGLLDIE